MSGDARPGPPIPQHAVLVLPSNGEFDSRAYRIARALVERGHTVTVLGRLMGGVAPEEVHPLGYRIIRVPVSSIDGLPLQPLVRLGRASVRRLYAWRTGTPYRPPETPPARASLSAGAPGTTAAVAAPATPAAAAALSGPDRRASLPRRVASGLMRRLAVPLTLRSHTRNARAVAPAADLYHGMAYMGIPIALDLAKRRSARVVYDARDIYLDARNLARMPGPARWLLARAERGWARRADRVVTVNQAYAEVMGSRWGVEPLVVMNCSFRFDPPEPPERRFHDVLGLSADTRVVLYHGGFFPNRGIEELMAAIPDIPGAVLVLLGYGALERELLSRAAAPELAGRVYVLPAVPPQDLHAWVACADVVAMPIQPSTLNHRLTTPNKLFEAMAAGVPVVASDLPGMATIVREVGFGVLCDPTDPAAVSAALREVLAAPPERRAEWRAAALSAAHEKYNWDTQAQALLDEYTRLTGRPW